MDGKTIETYNQMAKDYDAETADFWQRFPRTMLDLFAQSVHGPALDVGSGPGRDALLLQERGIQVTCLDASAAMIELCKEKGLWAYGADAAGKDAWSATLNTPCVLVIGSEGYGLRPLVRASCDELLRIPQVEHGVGSLNASCAATALLYETIVARHLPIAR